MSERKLASPGRFLRLGGLERYCQFLVRALASRAAVPADELDDWLKRDIGVEVTPPRDPRDALYRNMHRRGQPLL